MSETVGNVILQKGIWTNLYASTGIQGGAAVSVYNKGAHTCLLCNRNESPAPDKTLGIPLYAGESGSFAYVEASAVGLWAYSEEGTILSVQDSMSIIAYPPSKAEQRTSQNRKIVVIGASTAAGAGADAGKGWAALLAESLAPQGYTLVNKAIGGQNSTQCMDRFYIDAVPENPAFVIIGHGLTNENISGTPSAGKAAVYAKYVSNIRRMVAMGRELGYKVIVTSTFPFDQFDAEDYKYCKQMLTEFDNSDIPFINFMGALDDGFGHFRTGMSNDTVHPNNIGNQAMFKAFEPSLFPLLASGSSLPIRQKSEFVAFTESTADNAVPITYQMDSGLGSFTVAATIRCTESAVDGGAARPLISLESSQGPWETFRIRTANNKLVLSVGGVDIITTTADVTTNKPFHVALMYDFFSSIWKVFIDGELAGTATREPQQAVAFDRVIFGTRTGLVFPTSGFEYSKLAVWRTALNAKQVKDAYSGIVSKSSLSLYSPLVDSSSEVGYNLTNLALSTTSAKITATGIKINKVVSPS